MCKSCVVLTLDSGRILSSFVSLMKDVYDLKKWTRSLQNIQKWFRSEQKAKGRAVLRLTPPSASSRSAPPLAEWAVPQSSRLKYRQLFNSHDKTMSGHLTGTERRALGEGGLCGEARRFRMSGQRVSTRLPLLAPLEQGFHGGSYPVPRPPRPPADTAVVTVCLPLLVNGTRPGPSSPLPPLAEKPRWEPRARS